MNDLDIENAVVRGIGWLKKQKPGTIKDISRSIQSLSMWDEPVQHLIELLFEREKDGVWETDSTITDTSRACIALAGCGIIRKEAVDWISDQQKADNWNNNEIDTAYALIALSDCGEKIHRAASGLYLIMEKNGNMLEQHRLSLQPLSNMIKIDTVIL